MEKEFSDDPAIQELQSLQAIYPGAEINLALKRGRIEIPVVCEDGEPVNVKVATCTKAALSAPVIHLPPLVLSFSISQGYPMDIPPQFDVTCKFLSKSILTSMRAELLKLWESYHDQVLYSMVDHLNIETECLENLLPNKVIDCDRDEELYQHLIEHNRMAVLDAFEAKIHLCQICQNDVSGTKCLKFESCDHVFCNACLDDFFSSLILEGTIEKVHCPDFDCTGKFIKKRDLILRLDSATGIKFQDFRAELLTPPVSIDQLSRILNSPELILRYQTLYTAHQHDVISKLFPKRLVQCPRIGCDEQIFRENVSDPLVRCGRCKYAFCNDCRHSWHGLYKSCSTRNVGKYAGIPVEALELWLELADDSMAKRKLSYQYGKMLIKKTADEYLMDKLLDEMINDGSLGLHRCPTCSVIIQRSDGCNKMCCSSCRTFFCNLCGAYLDQYDPYDHYRNPESSCYRKLFEGMPGAD